MRHTYLMCEPTSYDVEYVINPHMRGNIHKVDKHLANEQWHILYNIISELANVELITHAPGLPDMVFTANAGLPIVGTDYVWLSKFAKLQRQGEERLFHGWFLANGFQVIAEHGPSIVFFEGAGDALIDPSGQYWLGHGQRSTEKATRRLANFFHQNTFHILELTDTRFYHLDTCFAPLSKGHFLCYPSAVKGDLPQKMIEVSEEDAMRFACNAICIDDTVIMPDCSDELIGKVADAGYTVQNVDLSEFIKAGGAAKCLALQLR